MRPTDKKASRSAFTSANRKIWTVPGSSVTGNIEEEASIGVSTSGSSSNNAEDEPAKITTRVRKMKTK
jgi:hypothetical protein